MQHLSEQMGEDGFFTGKAIFDPGGQNGILYGFFDDNTNAKEKDKGNVLQKNSGRRFVLSEIPVFDVYQGFSLYIEETNLTYKIRLIDRDIQGVQVLWLS